MRLNQVTIPVSDVSASKDFYRQLGFRLLVDTPHYVRFLAPQGETTFSLHLSSGPVVPGAVIYLECDALDDEVAALKAEGFNFETDPADMDWLWREANQRWLGSSAQHSSGL